MTAAASRDSRDRSRPTYRNKAAEYDRARRNGGMRRGQQTIGVFSIEGQTVDLVAIGARLGVTDDTARKRLKREAAKPGPVTWAGLAIPGDCR
jgi:hypothetical protein